MRAVTNAKFDSVDANFKALRIEIDALRADTKQQFDNVRADINLLRSDTKEKFDKVDARFERIDQRFEQLEAKLEVRFDKIDARFEKIDERFDELASMKRYVITTGIAIIATICAAGSPLWFELL